jgi:1-aminocyclopropane-1-carboxylate deaminase
MFQLPSPLQKIEHPLFKEFGVELYIKRDDLIHPDISGNKWRKLKFNIEKYKQKKYDSILTFGGAYSNHIAATAATGKAYGVPTIGIIRGDELDENSNETLSLASDNGMKLVFVSRSKYSERYERVYHEELRLKFGNALIVNEGGANFHGVIGCGEILSEIDFIPDYIYTASGTGTTAAGLVLSSKSTKVVSVPVFKNGGFIKDDVEDLLSQFQFGDELLTEKMSLLELNLHAHFGGYGKFNQELIDFINDFYSITQIKLDQIYTGKMMYALMEDVKSNKFKKGAKIIALHTGGLQGLSSIKDQLTFKL